jgi:mRNA-degrading endonuclease RelE of RelBE toxin-antitoxin system
MSYKFSLHPDTQKDFTEAYEWYQDKTEGLGERFLKAVRKKIEEIATNPEIYGSKGRKGYREAKLNLFPYVIGFKIYEKKKSIFISSIHHLKKHPNKKYRK